MENNAVLLSEVSKKFKKGEIYDSLRDLIPALTGKLFKNDGTDMTLHKKEFWALKNVSFNLVQGEAFGIIGHNGAGKSTILKILSGIMKPDVGKIKIEGRLSALIEVGAGFHPDLTGRENIYLNGTILGMSRKEVQSKFDEIVSFSGLGDFIDTPVKRYSSGMYARLGFSVAAHVDPDVLIIDEVLSVGDFLFQRKCLDKMTSIIKGGATVIFVSHNLKAVAELCNRSLLLNHGEIAYIGDTNEAIKKYLDYGNLIDQTKRYEKEVFINSVKIRSEEKETVRFSSGEKAWIEVEIKASKDVEQVAVVLDLKDDQNYHLFDTSSQRLGKKPFNISAGESKNLVFELDLHLASGTFHTAVTLYRYDIEKAYDTLFPASTFYVSPINDIRGVVNLNPKVH